MSDNNDWLTNALQREPFTKMSAKPWDGAVTLPTWQLDHLIPQKSIGMLYGASNSGKSHLVCDYVVACINGDKEWHGQAMQPGAVVMFSESIGHIKARLKAYQKLHGKEQQHGLYLNPSMSFDRAHIHPLAMWLAGLEEAPMLMVFDTFSTSFGIENENDNTEVAKLIKAIEEYLVPVMHPDGAIMIVHHTSKVSDGHTARGASALIGNIDWSIHVEWDKELGRTVATWAKDRWQLIEGQPQWAGHAERFPVEFSNGGHEMMVLAWERWSEEQTEAHKEIEREKKQDAIQSILVTELKRLGKPVYLHSESAKSAPAGYAKFNLAEAAGVSPKMTPELRQFLLDNYQAESVHNTKGDLTGYMVDINRPVH